MANQIDRPDLTYSESTDLIENDLDCIEDDGDRETATDIMREAEARWMDLGDS